MGLIGDTFCSDFYQAQSVTTKFTILVRGIYFVRISVRQIKIGFRDPL